MSSDQAGIDPYQVLKIRRDATPSEIAHAYRRLALWHCPERGRVVDLAPEERRRRRQVFAILAASYETLMDKEAKVRLDALLKESSTAATAGPTMTQTSRAVTPPPADPSDANLGNGAVTTPPRHSPLSNTQASKDAKSIYLPLDLISVNSTSSLPTLGDPSSWSPGSSKVTHSCQLRKKDRHRPRQRRFLLWTTSSDSLDRNKYGEKVEDRNEASYSIGRARARNIFTNSSSTSMDTDDGSLEGEKHYTELETNRLFGGPLHLLYRARRWKPFSNPYVVFAHAFHSEPWHATSIANDTRDDSIDLQSTTGVPDLTGKYGVCSATSIRLPDGSIQVTTVRLMHNRRLIRTETIKVDAATGKRQSHVSVTSEPIETESEAHTDELVSMMSLPGCGLDFTFCFSWATA